MVFKFTSTVFVCGFVALMFSGAINASSKASNKASSKDTKLESYHKWLQGDWGQTNKDGTNVEMRGCALETPTPDPLYKGKLKSQYNLPIGYFFDGVISFGMMSADLQVISNYTLPDYMFKKKYENLRQSAHAHLTLTPGVDKKGYVTFVFDKIIPGLDGLTTIVPLTNDSFKLTAKAANTRPDTPDYYFTRCENL